MVEMALPYERGSLMAHPHGFDYSVPEHLNRLPQNGPYRIDNE